MGLDISSYRKLSPVTLELDEYGEPACGGAWYERYFRARFNPDFPGRADGLTDGQWYEFAEGDGFRAGSYGGYNAWREWLAKLAGYPAIEFDEHGGAGSYKIHSQGAWNATGGPFWELINFSDCDGVIGPVVAAKLVNDFAVYDERAKAADQSDEWNYTLYQRWREAFEMAADGGAVEFH